MGKKKRVPTRNGRVRVAMKALADFLKKNQLGKYKPEKD
jgi:hypothetical protein